MISYNLSYSCTSSSLRHPYRCSVSGTSALAYRPPNFRSRGHPLRARPGLRLRDTGLYHLSQAHGSVPFVSGTRVCTICLSHTGLYHLSQAHGSVPFVSGTQVCTICLRHTGLYHLSQGHGSVPFVSGTRVCTICLRHIRL